MRDKVLKKKTQIKYLKDSTVTDQKFGQHSGLGLNIVKNLVDLHNATIKATNRQDKKGASMEIEFPKV